MIRNLVIVLFASFVCLSCSGKKEAETRGRAANSAPVSNPDLRPTLVAFGDSLTAGAGVPEDQNYPAKLQSKIDSAGYRYRVVNAGVNGDTSSQGLNRIQSVTELHPSITIVEFGANDGLRGIPVPIIRQNMEDIVARLQSAGSKVVLAGMQIPPNYGPQYTSAFKELFPAVAKKYRVFLVPFFLEGVGGRPELNQDDGIHPIPAGYDVVVENVWKILKPLL